MQKIRVRHPMFFSSSDQNLHHDFSFHRSKAAFNFMLWKRRWDHLSCKCTIIILFVCMFVFVCSSSIILIWFSYFHTSCIKVLFLSYSVGEFKNNTQSSVGGRLFNKMQDNNIMEEGVLKIIKNIGCHLWIPPFTNSGIFLLRFIIKSLWIYKEGSISCYIYF